MAQLPQVVRGLSKSMESENQLETQFYGRWPALRQYSGKVRNILETYRKFNPQATAEQIREEGGMQAMMLLRLPLEQGASGGGGTGTGGQQTTTNKPTRAPAAPARAAAVTGSPQPKSENLFTSMAEAILEDDELDY